MVIKFYNHKGAAVQGGDQNIVAITGLTPKIKQNRNGNFFNPVTDQLNLLTRIDAGIPVYRYAHVSQESVGLYVKFLKERNNNLLRQAERAK